MSMLDRKEVDQLFLAHSTFIVPADGRGSHAVMSVDQFHAAIAQLESSLQAHQPVAPEAAGVVKLPDGSACAIVSLPLPKDHWLYAPHTYSANRPGHEPDELREPVLGPQYRDAVVAAARYAVRAATMCGQEPDFDPDALVRNTVCALCGPYAHGSLARDDRTPSST
ncbi:hypothetical protein HDG34_003249 [Paraburkholderia sp. HC6.4b]|uniref:hypothetical protein n=1 Tax=unclassified Paraburkholderia TaxID=2615204 RepID=UPI001616856C|nr:MULTISPECIES: hypothetical protein [unclassified Paraburkholderia]MBB5409308.1 hypothetical protein [Paraburkholderia sp. HC6.4b]MBB5451036.1 hypothetical protein [Paraburkholderia sp. Kb1A]